MSYYDSDDVQGTAWWAKLSTDNTFDNFDDHILTMDEAVDSILRERVEDPETPYKDTVSTICHMFKSAVDLNDVEALQGDSMRRLVSLIGLDYEALIEGLEAREGHTTLMNRRMRYQKDASAAGAAVIATNQAIIDDIIANYQKYPAKELGLKHQISRTTVRTILKKHGLSRTAKKGGTLKLNPEDVIKIRQQLAEGADPRDLAKQYGVHKTNIYAIKANRTWKELL